MKKVIALYCLLIALLVPVVAPVVVMADNISNASYSGIVRVTNNATATTNVATVFSANITTYDSTGANTTIRYAGSPIPFMPALSGEDTWVVWVSAINQNANIDDTLYTDHTTGGMQRIFGTLTIADDSSMELSDNGSMELKAWLGGAGDLVRQTDAFAVTRGASNVTATYNGTVQQYLTTGDDAGKDFSGAVWIAQMFTTENTTYTLDKVKLKLYQATTPDTVTVSIRVTASGKPTGADLTSGTIDGNTITTGTGGLWYDIDLANYQLLPATQYAIVVRAQSPTLYWRRDTTSPPYAGGWSASSTDSGATWGAYSVYDNLFQIFSASPSLTISGVSSAEHEIEVALDSPFFGLARDTPVVLPVTDNLTLNVPLWQSECSAPIFPSIDDNALTATVNGATWSSTGYVFDGTNDEILVGDDAALDVGELTALVWVYPTAAGNRGILAKRNGTGAGSTNYNFFLNAGMGISVYNGIAEGPAASSTAMPLNAWSLCGVIWDGSAVTFIYNGAADGTTTLAIGNTNNHDLAIGSNGGVEFFKGRIGDAVKYDKAWTVATALQFYNATKWKYDGSTNRTGMSTLATVPSVPSSDWIIGGDATPYIESYKHYVGGNLVSDISWQNSTTLSDASEHGNDAILTPRTTTSDPDVSATLLSFGPIIEARVVDFSLGSALETLATYPWSIPQMFSSGNYTYIPAADAINALLDLGDVPRALWWHWFIFGGIAILGFLTYGATAMRVAGGRISENGDQGSVLLMCVTVGVLLAIFGIMNPIPFWPALLFWIPAAAILLSTKHQAVG